MKGLLLSLGLLAACAFSAMAEVPVQPDFQEDKILGRWYSIGLASNSKWFQANKDKLKMCTTTITPAADGDLQVVATFPKMDRCEQKTMSYTKTEQPGRFLSRGYGGESLITIVETNYQEYILMHARKTKGAEVNTIVSMFGRGKELPPNRLQEFHQFCLDQGLSQDNILILPQTDKCMTEE
ncbi:lipocalin-like [Spea bombifrons]|uniref:lipocalin-like n=1 Tax=Spea bombifrons TaxID=233779 RepID=UPI002349E723|nr:lipocalin-like [Spea bombifrons]